MNWMDLRPMDTVIDVDGQLLTVVACFEGHVVAECDGVRAWIGEGTAHNYRRVAKNVLE